MKRLIYIFAAMLVIPVSCDKFHVYNTSGNGSGNNGSSSEQGGGGDQGGQGQGNDQYSIKGAVKTITLECIRPKSGGGGNITSSKDIKTIIYDEKARPKQIDIESHVYNPETGVELEVLTSHVYFVYNADGSFKCRQRDYDIDILGAEKYSVDAAGCATHREYGYTENDVWKKISSFDYTFKTIDGKDGYFFTGTSNISEGSNLEYDWGSDGNLIRARRNPAIEEEDTYDSGNTIYFFYTPDRNPTFGAPFDITTLVLPSFGFSYLTNAPISGFPYSGHGTATLPDYLNTDKRNMAATFNYEWSRNESKIEKITKTRYPLFDKTVVWTDVYTFTYYE